MTKKFLIRDREAGNVIEECNSLEEAKKILEECENEDKKDNIFVGYFYEIIESEEKDDNEIIPA